MQSQRLVRLVLPILLAPILMAGCLGAPPRLHGAPVSIVPRDTPPRPLALSSATATNQTGSSPMPRPLITRLRVAPTPSAIAPATPAPGPSAVAMPWPSPGAAVGPTPSTVARQLVVVRAGRGGPVVRTQPASGAPVLSGLYYDTYLPVFGQATDAHGVLWDAVRLWGVLPGWIEASQTLPGDPPPPTPTPATSSGWTAPWPSDLSAVQPLTSSGVLRDAYNLRATAGTDGVLLATLAPGTSVQVRAWQADAAGSAWYEVDASGQTGWVLGAGVDLVTGTLSRTQTDDSAAAIAGKGAWLPLALLQMASPQAIIQAARDLGVTHLYVEVGSSGHFVGQRQLDALLPVAHQAGIKVLGWVLTPLEDLPLDVSTCLAIADYRTPSGDQLDGLAPDVEFNMNPDDVTAFAQIVRTEVGPQRLIVGVIYPAGTWIGQQYPIALPLSQSFNALAPMDYWHDTSRSYTAQEVGQFIRASVADIHQIVGDPRYPVEPIGQAYDSFSRNGAGPNNPTGGEVAAALQAAKDSGAIGVSLFQWATTTPAEWNALDAFQWDPSQ